VEIIILPSYKQVSHEVSRRIILSVRKNPGLVLGLATGKTMLGVYQNLVSTYQKENIDFSQVITFNLDEYIGLSPNDPLSFHSYMKENFFSKININPENTHILPTQPNDIEDACQEFENLIKKSGGIDLQILGIGREGHIGFNEPSSSLQARTRVKTLTKTTLRDNFGLEKGPRFALTMGIGTIMDSNQILLMASGKVKAQAIARAVEGPLSSSCPASILQFHRDAKIILDRQAASLLKRKDYYKWVWKHKNEVNDVIKDKK